MPRKKKAPAKDYYTVGVRFLYTTNRAMIYTYKIPNRVKLHLGQELIADTPHGSSIVVVVRIDKTPQDTEVGITYKFITRKVAPL